MAGVVSLLGFIGRWAGLVVVLIGAAQALIKFVEDLGVTGRPRKDW